MPHLKNHVVICNWNERAPEFVRVLHAKSLGQHEEQWYPIAVIAERCEPFPNEDCFEDTFYIPGAPLSPDVLKRANVEDANTVIIVADASHMHPDDNTLRIALRLRAFLREAGRETVRIVAEVMEPSNATIFRRTSVTGIHEVVCGRELDLRALAQTSITPGLTIVLQELIDYGDDTNSIYSVPIPERWIDESVGIASFGQLRDFVVRMRGNVALSEGTILLGLARQDGYGKVRFMISPSSRALKADGGNGLSQGDRIIVMARSSEEASESVLQQGDAR